MLYPRLKDMLEQELKKSGYDIPVVGYIPEDEAFRLESRHLGLVTPQELNDLKEQTERAGRILAESVDLDQILSIAQAAPELETKETRSVHPADGYGLAENGLTENSLMGDGCSVRDGKDRKEGQKRLRIGIARDEAFCFYYKANLELLEEMGCELVSFSPLNTRSSVGRYQRSDPWRRISGALRRKAFCEQRASGGDQKISGSRDALSCRVRRIYVSP